MSVVSGRRLWPGLCHNLHRYVLLIAVGLDSVLLVRVVSIGAALVLLPGRVGQLRELHTNRVCGDCIGEHHLGIGSGGE